MIIHHINDAILQMYNDIKNEKGEIVIPKEWYKIIKILIFALQVAKLFTSDDVDKIIDIIIEALEKCLVSITPPTK